MKKKLLSILLVVAVIVGVAGVTISVASKTTPQKAVINDTDEKATTSKLYEVVDFVPPTKTVYSLSEVYTVDLSTKEGEKRFVQGLDFDGTGMSMTVKNQKTGETKKYEYTCEYFNLEGEEIKCEGALSFYFNPELNTVLTAGEHTTEIMLVTDDSECVMHEMTFTLIDDTIKETQAPNKKPTQAETQPQTQTNTQQSKPVADKNTNPDSKQDKPVENLVIPQMRTLWYHSNNPNGCTIEITNQKGNTLSFTICCTNEKATKIATADVTVTLNDVYEDGSIVRGNGSFEYTDSFGNSGTGTLNVSENVILMVINEEHNAGRGFGISNSTGKYL